MSNLDDFIKSISIFKGGLQEYQQNKALSSAAEQVQQLSQLEDEKARMLGMTQVQNELALRLSASGADASKIQAATANLAPSAGAQFQASESRDLQASGQGFQREMQEDQQAHQIVLQSMGLKKEGAKVDERRRKELGTFTGQYQSQLNTQISKDLDAYYSGKTALDAIKANQPIGIDFAKMALAKTQTGAQMTDAEREVFSGSKEVKEKIRQAALERINGKLTPANQRYLANVAKMLVTAAQKKIDTKAKHIAGQAYQRAKATGFETSQEEMYQMLNPIGLGTQMDQSAPPPAPAGDAAAPAPQQPAPGGLNKYMRD